MASLANPLLANNTILARITSRYEDSYLPARLTNSVRSRLVSLIEKGLFLGMPVPPLPRIALSDSHSQPPQNTSPYL
jgi:hypothetical protein